MTKDMPQVTLRDVTPDDDELLVRLYHSVREPELALTGWSAAQCDAFVRMQFAAQQVHYRTHYPTGVHQIILLAGQPVGRIYWADLKDELHFLDITVLPEYRSRGIGTPLIQGFLERAAAAGKPARIFVESFNPSLRLFERLGFTCIKADGHLLLLEWRADNP
ncbi:MAG TPA: GNAT family N-acetyltransferase [Blastocatellia bacterium]|nr:GNAT family N-acetyltransferase [Blastocatellia bacterium]